MMTVFIILLLIVLNGLFVAAEFALLGAPRAALEQMGVSGNMVARRVSQILKTPPVTGPLHCYGAAWRHVRQSGVGYVRRACGSRMAP